MVLWNDPQLSFPAGQQQPLLDTYQLANQAWKHRALVASMERPQFPESSKIGFHDLHYLGAT